MSESDDARLMREADERLMREAIEWAKVCNPVKESVPKVGAIIAVDGKPIGRGRRAPGLEGDDQHAEWHAIENVKDKSQLPNATLYTTLEPCTPEVRTDPEKCCTRLIRKHQVRKVFIGILDPNQGVTGKGLSALQEENVEVALFPHELAKQIRAINADFIRTQQSLRATIISPKEGEVLRAYETGDSVKLSFTCLNPPGDNNFLLQFRDGVCYPQSGPLRQVSGQNWEVPTHFGLTGEHTLQLVTATTNLGKTLIDFYWKVVDTNHKRRDRLKQKLSDDDMTLLRGDYIGIPMGSLPKGFRLEASVTVTIAEKPKVPAVPNKIPAPPKT
jgi:pyrimidine deaminase RibD-like protein